ncbi:MAG: adenylate/guanylate cyclase domain-containing protein [bacterium]
MTLLVIVTITMVNIHYQRQDKEEEAQLRMMAVTGIIQRSLAGLGEEAFTKWADSIFKMRFATDEYNLDIVYIMILDNKNTIIYLKKNPFISIYDSKGKLINIEKIKRGEIEDLRVVKATVMKKGTNKTKNIIQVGYSTVMLNSIYTNIIIRNIIIGVIFIIIGIIFSYLIAHNWNTPIKQMITAMENVSDGNLNIKINTKRADEIGYLQRTFNFMIEGLRDREFIKNTFKRYVTKQVAEEILKNKDKIKLEGEKKIVTVLFSDIRGFTAMSEEMTPQETLQLLNEYYGAIIDIIFKYEGALDKFLGDGIMVFWNAPIEQEDHAIRACKCAIEMQKALNLLNNKRRDEKKKEIYIGIGVNTGEAVAGNVGSIERMEYTVVGDTVNLTQRINDQTDRGQILISESTFNSVMDRVVATPLPPQRIKGKKNLVKVWLLHDIKQ